MSPLLITLAFAAYLIVVIAILGLGAAAAAGDAAIEAEFDAEGGS